MTMEELADKWIKQNCCECCVNKDDCDAGTIDCFAKQAFLAGYETLEKENAALKETIRKGTFCGDWNDDVHMCQMYLKHEELQMYIHQLTEAKEIIKKIENIFYSGEDSLKRLSQISDILKEAEKFIKEVK